MPSAFNPILAGMSQGNPNPGGVGGPSTGLQPGPVEIGPRPPIEPRQEQGPPQPALQDEPEMTPEMAESKKREIAPLSAEAAKTGSTEDKEEMNKAIEAMGIDLETAYNEAVEMLGGIKEVPELKMERQDWGLFLMDFGMRMMAASTGDTGGGIGGAGAGALQGVLGRHAADQTAARDYNQNLQDRALDFAGDRVARQDKTREEGNIVWTDKGAFNMMTRQYERGPEGGVLQAGTTPGGHNRGYARGFSSDALQNAGLSREQADLISHGGAPTKQELRFEFGKRYDTLKEAGGRTTMPDGKGGTKQVRWNETTEEDRRRWVNARVEDVWAGVPEQGQGPALVQPGPAAGGRRPQGMNKQY